MKLEEVHEMNRREFINIAFFAALSSSLQARERRPPRILLRSSWQTVNIGDIAHTPGVLALLEKYAPSAEIRLWPGNVGNGVAEMLMRRFPKLQIVRGDSEREQAFRECDFLLHGSGPSFVAESDVAKWHRTTGRNYGIYGITLSPKPAAHTVEAISGAKFAFFRDSASLRVAREAGCACPVMEFGPDGAFAVDLRNDAAAEAFLSANGLERGKYLCCIPRLRQTPYWKIKPVPFDEKKNARNEQMKEHDHLPLRQAIIRVVREAGLRVLICPEDATQMEVGREMLLNKLPDDVKPHLVCRPDFWLTDEALSTYVFSAGLFGNEMHSPIMCIGNGVPAIVCRWAEQTSKGFMWRDIGLGDWLFDLDQEGDLAKVAPAVLEMAMNREGALAKVKKARKFVENRQRETMSVLASSLP